MAQINPETKNFLTLLKNTNDLKKHVLNSLAKSVNSGQDLRLNISDWSAASAVLFLLGRRLNKNDNTFEPCLILNKRSRKVKQAGDLCCPGGRVSHRFDSIFGSILRMPFFPVARWNHWSQWRKTRSQDSHDLSILYATSLRESFEEMRLNPLRVKFLGPLPNQELYMFHRVIHPMVGWVSKQKKFVSNWEVEKVVCIPLKKLLDPENYYRYRLSMSTGFGSNDWPGFLVEDSGEKDVLWGATYRITTVFLKLVFGFTPPDLQSLPLVHGTLDENYYNGSK